MAGSITTDLSGIRNSLINELREIRKEVQKEGEKIGQSISEGIEDGFEDSFDDVITTIQKSEKELLKDLERAQKRFEKYFKKFPAAFSKATTSFDFVDLRLVTKNMDNALDDIKEAMVELRDIGAHVDDSWLENMQKQMSSMHLPGQTLTSDVDSLVKSLGKLDSINAAPLNKLVKSIVRDKTIISSEIQEILQSLNLINSAGAFTGKFITEGMNNSGVITNDRYAIVSRSADVYDEYNQYDFDFKNGTTYIDNLIAKEKEAAAQGVNLARVLDVVKSKASSGGDLFYEIQEFAPGQQVHIFDEEKKTLQGFEQECKRVASATDAHIHKLMSDIIALSELGFRIDFSPANILYDTAKGFTLIDLELRDLNDTIPTTQDLVEGLVYCLTGFEDNVDRLSTGMSDADKWATSMQSVYQRLITVFNQDANFKDVAKTFSNNDFIKYIAQDVHQIESVKQEMIKFNAYMEENHAKITSASDGLNQYGLLLAEVSKGAMTAEKAIDKLNAQLVENKALTRQSGTAGAYTPPLSDPTLSGLLKGVDIKSLTNGITLSQENRTKLENQIVDLARSVESTVKDSNSPESQGQIYDHVGKIVDLIVSQGTYKVDNNIDKSRYAEFLNHLKTNLVRYTDDDKKEFGDDWRSVIGKFGGNNKILTKNPSALTVNEQWGELKELFSDILTSNAENEKQQLKDLLATAQIARDNLKSKKTISASLTDSDRSVINEQTLNVMDQIWYNAEKIHKAEQKIVAEDRKQLEAESKTAQEAAKTVAVKKEELATEKQITAENLKQTAQKGKKPEPVPIIDKNTEKALEQLRQAESNKTPLIDLSGVYNTDDLTKELQGMAQTAWNEKGFVVDRIKVEGSTAAIKLYNKELEMSITQTYKMDAANEEAAASLKHLNDAYDYNVKALRGQDIDADFEKRFAEAQIDNLIQPLKGAKYEGESNLRTLAGDIVDDKSLKAFNNEMRIAKVEVSTFKKELASDLDTTTKMSNTMLKATGVIKSYRQEYEKLKDVASSNVLKTSIDDMEAAANDYKITDSLEKQVEAFNKYDKAKKIFDSNIKSIRTEAQAFQNAQKIQQEQINAAWTNEFQKNYKYNNGKTAQDQTTLNSMADFYRKEEAEAKNFNNNMKSIYNELMSNMKQINTLDTKINDLTLKDGGSGLYKNAIQSLQSEKSALVANMKSISAEINSSLNIQPGENGIARFFDVARERAALSSAEIQKFDELLMQADRIGFDFASKITSTIQPTVEKINSLKQMISDGTITDNGVIQGISSMESALKSKMENFKKYGDASSAMDLTAFNNSISTQIAGLERLAQKEAQYFAGKRQYAKGANLNSGFNALSTDVKSTEKGLDSIQSKLSAAVKEFTNSEAIITGFKQSADGISTLNFSVFDKGTNSLRQFSMEMGTLSGKMYVTEQGINKSAHSVQAASQQLTKMGSLLKTLELSNIDIVPETAHSSVQRLHALMTQLSAAMQKGDTQMIDKLLRESKLATSEVQKLYDTTMKLQNAVGDEKAKRIGSYIDSSNVTAYDQLTDAVRKHGAVAQGATLEIGKFNEKQNALNYTLTRGDGNVEHYTASIDSLNKKIVTQQQGVTKLQTGWQHFSNVVSRSSKQMLMAFAGYNIFTQALHTIRQGVTYIKEIDLAMTELKKVTDETQTSYARFLETAARTGSKIGATTSDFVNATADFARIGYSMNEAGKMAEAAIVYKNVADGLDTVEAATESITSTMKAFGIESSGTMGIIDSFNEVGNNFAITSAGIGEALKRSASALAAGGNTMEEAVGLITGANTVVQDPEVVGTALKTLSLRIRGVKTELEEAGLETENMAETTAQLQAKLLALTGGKVDIMIDEDNFKSTTQILREMAAVWEDMTDVQQAAALELIGGKRQANILASLISNFEVAEDAIETAANSAGSALRENEVWLDSIEGKTTQLTNAMQNMWNHAITSEGVKFFLDVANTIVKVTDKVGLLKIALAGVFGALAASKKNSFGDFFTFNTKMPKNKALKNGLWAGLGEAFKQFSINKKGAGKLFDVAPIKKYISSIRAASAAQSGFTKVTAIGKAMTDASVVSDLKKAATLKAVGVASTVASVGVQVFNAALTMGISLLATGLITGVMTLIDNAIHHAENLKQEVQELTDAYNESKQAYSDNIDKLTTPSDTDVYSTLLEEFEALTKGVSKNGDNISLTADQYERYREICDTICEVNPDLAAGYDSTTEAIGNNANALRDLIAVQQEAARREAVEYTSDDNMKKYAEEAITDHIDANTKSVTSKAEFKNALRTNLGKDLYGDNYKGDVAKDGEKIAREFLKRAGLTQAEINKQIQANMSSSGNFLFDTWFSENADYIAEHVSGYSSEIQKAASEYRDASSDLVAAKDGVVSELLEIPSSIEGYAELSGSEKSFITEWIKNSDMFKIDEATTEAEVLQMKSDIQDIVNNVIQGDYTTQLEDGTTVNASDILDSIFNFDTTNVKWEKYQNEINAYINQLWDAIGGENNKFGFEDKDALKLSLGIDFQIEDEKKMVKRYAELKDVTQNEAEKYFDNLPATEVQRLLQVDWNIVDKNNIDEILSPTVSTGKPSKVYSELAADVESYNEVLSQSHNIVSDNTVVTKEFYDSLVELAGSEEEVAKYFDAANPLMVKNARALNELVEVSRDNVSANIEVAQSQARLEYFELVQELGEVCNVTSDLTDAQIDNAHSIMDQINAVQQAIYKYQLLETSLNAAGGAFKRFNEAKEVDSLNTTGDSYVEMVQTIQDGFKSGQVGTQAFEAAVEGVIPDSVYKGLKNDAEKLKAIHDYFNDDVVPSLTRDKEGAISIDQGDVEKFVNKGKKSGLFEGSTYTGLSVVEGMDLEKGAELMGVTEAHLVAMLSELEKYDYNTSAESFLSQMDGSFDGKVSKATSEIQKLNEQKLALLEDGGYEDNKEAIDNINTKLAASNKELQTLRGNAVDSFAAYADNQHVIESLNTVEDKTRKISDVMTKEQALELGINWDESKNLTVQEAMDTLKAKQMQLEEPTELMVQFAQEGVIDEIDDLIDQIEKDKQVELGVTYNKDTGEYEVDEDSKYVTVDSKTGEYKVSGLGELGTELESNLNTLTSINSWLDTGLVTTESLLGDIKATLNALYKDKTGKDAPGSENKDKGPTDLSNAGKEGKGQGKDLDELNSKLPSWATLGLNNDGKTPAIPGFTAGFEPPQKDGEKNKNIAQQIKDARKELKDLEKEKAKLEKVAKTETPYDIGSDQWDAVAKKQEKIKAKEQEIKNLRIQGYDEALTKMKDLEKSDKEIAIKAVTEYENGGSLDDLLTDLQAIENKEIRTEVIATLTKEGAFDTLLSDLDKGDKKIVIKALTEGTGDVEELNKIIDTLPPEVQSQVRALVDGALENVKTVDGKLQEIDGKTAETTVTGDASDAVEAAKTAEDAITGVTPKWPTIITGDASDAITAASAADSAINGITDTKETKIKATIADTFWEKIRKAKEALAGVVGANGTVHANGTAHAKGTAWAGGTAHKGGSWGAKKTETALVGELGPEIVVRGNRWFTVGDSGAEFTNIQKGDIIFNHKQTEQLLSNGYVTSRGKMKGKAHAQGTAHAEGTAYAFWYASTSSSNSNSNSTTIKKKGKPTTNKKETKDYSADFEEVFDWFEVRIEEINEDLDLMAAKLENAVTIKGKNSILDSMIKTNKSELTTLEKGYKLYNSYANNLLTKIPKKYRDEAKNGKIAIEEFAGKVDEKTLEAIKNYRDWAQKAAEVKKNIQEIRREITELAKQKFDNIGEKYDNITGLQDNRQQHYLDMADYREDKGYINSGRYYNAAISEEKNQKTSLQNEKKKLQASLDASVKKGDIKKYSNEWYEMVNQIHAVDAAIDECTANIEEYQNRANEIHFENFEKGLYRISRLADETQNIIDLMADKDIVTTPDADSGWDADDVAWSKEGITQMGLYAQNMENYRQQSELYAKEIDEVNKMYDDGKISYQEYLEKLGELKDGQYDAIQGYEDSKKAIVELQEARIDEIKNGIDKQIEAYEELIEKKKEELDAEKDLYDFQRNVMDQSKDIADIQRKLAALSGDNSSAAMAKRRQLEAELAEAQQGLEDTYYDRSIENKQTALDNQLEFFTETREAEKEMWDKYLENTEQVFKDSMEVIAESGNTIKNTLAQVGTEWDLQINNNIKKPWNDASTAIEATAERLDNITKKFNEAVDAADDYAKKQIDTQKDQNANVTDEVKDKFQKGEKAYVKKGIQAYDSKGNKTFKVGYNTSYTVVSTNNETGMTKVKTSDGKIRYFKTSDLSTKPFSSGSGSSSGSSSSGGTKTTYPYGKASNTTGNIGYGAKGTKVKAIQWALKKMGYSIGSSGIDGSFGPATQSAVKKFQKKMGISADGIVGNNTRKKFKAKGYAVGSTKIDKDQIALLHELGDELVLHAGQNGKLEYLSKGSGVVPADLTSNLMSWGELNPQDILDRNRPSIGASPEVHATEINLNIQYGDMLKIENFKGDNPDEVAKIVAKQFEKHTKDLNSALRKYVR